MTENLNNSNALDSLSESDALAGLENHDLEPHAESPTDMSFVFGVGDELRRAREARDWSINNVAQHLKLGAHQVEALEKEEWDKLPGRFFAIGFVRNYAKLLEIDSDALVERLNKDLSGKKPHLEIKKGEWVASQREPDNRAMSLGGIILLLAILGYFLLPANTLRSLENLLPQTQTHFKTEKNSALTVENEESPPQATQTPLFPPENTEKPIDESPKIEDSATSQNAENPADSSAKTDEKAPEKIEEKSAENANQQTNVRASR